MNGAYLSRLVVRALTRIWTDFETRQALHAPLSKNWTEGISYPFGEVPAVNCRGCVTGLPSSQVVTLTALILVSVSYNP